MFEAHVASMDELHAPGIEVAGNAELAQVVNSSMHALLGSYRADSPYSSAPEGLVSTRYSGHAFWDVETWQWPTWLVFWPDQAQAALQYRVDLMPQAAENARHLDVYLHDFAPGASDLDQHKPKVVTHAKTAEFSIEHVEKHGRLSLVLLENSCLR